MTVYENVTRNVTTEVSYNATRNVTVSHNVTVVENVTSVVNVTNTTVSQQPVDVVVALDSSASVGDDGWLDENEAARTLLEGLRENLAGNMSAGMSVWAAAKAVRIELAALADVGAIAAFAVDRLPYCTELDFSPDTYDIDFDVDGVIDYYSTTYSNIWCASSSYGGHNTSQSDYATTGTATHYTQALLSCDEEFAARGADGSFKLCMVVSDGGIMEDRFAQAADTTMRFTAAMTGDLYDAGFDVFVADSSDAEFGLYPWDYWIAPGAWDYCQAHGLGDCTVDAISASIKARGVVIQNILVGPDSVFTAEIQSRMSFLSSCNSTVVNYTGCPYVSKSESFEALTAVANTVASSVAKTVGTVTSSTSSTTRRESQAAVVVTEAALVTETATVVDATTFAVTSRDADTEKVTTQREICTGSGVSFVFLLLAVPLLVYLFFKPISNVFVNACCPPDKKASPKAPPDTPTSPCEMSVNPVFGKEMNYDAEAAALPEVQKKARGAIDNTRAKAARGRKKKKTFGFSSTPRGGGAGGGTGAGDSAPGAPASSPVHDYVIEEDELPPKPRAPVLAAVRRDSTEWGTGIAAVYDGDDWQEKVADFVIDLLCCRCAARKAAAEPAPDPRSERV